MDFAKIIDHPLAEEIIDKLVHGTSAKDVSDWLKLKYPEKDQSHLRLGSQFLESFVSSNGDLYEALRKDIAKVKGGGKIQKKIADSLMNSKSYQERLNELADQEIDIKKVVANAVKIIQIRAEQMFDLVQQNPESFKPDYVMIKWFETLLNATEKFDKIVNNAPDQIIQHNVTVQVMDQYVTVLQDSVREILSEMDPELAFTFMDKLNAKMDKIKLPEEAKVLSQDERLKQANLIKASFEEIQ